MKDLDFDELDRAVNSLITNTPVSNDNTEPKEKTININAALPRQTVNSQQATPTVSSLVGQRSSTGRFMDVVHPSSDMRTTSAMPERVSHQGVIVNPIPVPVAPDTPSAIVPAETSSPTTSANVWPDPIEFHEFKNSQTDKKEEPSKEKDEDADIDQINDDITNTLNQSSGDTPDSPFIPGTIVDKRPLGAFSTESPAPKVEPLVEKTTVHNEKTDAGIGPKLADASTPFPAELQDDLLLIEASDSTTQLDVLSVVDAPVAVPVVSPVIAPAAATNAPVVDNQPVGPTSITQQYKEQPSSGDQNTGAIYDTDAYHKPLLQPVKKKSGWLWVLWITILLVVGAGVGAAMYFFVLAH
jgi:hypothetical protein